MPPTMMPTMNSMMRSISTRSRLGFVLGTECRKGTKILKSRKKTRQELGLVAWQCLQPSQPPKVPVPLSSWRICRATGENLVAIHGVPRPPLRRTPGNPTPGPIPSPGEAVQFGRTSLGGNLRRCSWAFPRRPPSRRPNFPCYVHLRLCLQLSLHILTSNDEVNGSG